MLYDHPITVGILPASLVSLTFCFMYRQMIPPGAIPNTVKTLVMACNDLPRCLGPGSIPNTIQTLELGFHINNQPDDLNIPNGVIPITVKTLTLHQLPCSGTLPDHITTIQFGDCFNWPIRVGLIPDTIKAIIFGRDFNRPIAQGVIPSSIETLAFGDRFNQPLLPDTIPNSVTHISFSNEFKQSITSTSLPNSVKFLCFDQFFPCSLLLDIPRGVTHLTLGQTTINEFIQRLLPLVVASNVTHLSVTVLSETRCCIRCDDGFMQHTVNGCLDLQDLSTWLPAPVSKTELTAKILFSEIESQTLTADRFY